MKLNRSINVCVYQSWYFVSGKDIHIYVQNSMWSFSWWLIKKVIWYVYVSVAVKIWDTWIKKTTVNARIRMILIIILAKVQDWLYFTSFDIWNRILCGIRIGKIFFFDYKPKSEEDSHPRLLLIMIILFFSHYAKTKIDISNIEFSDYLSDIYSKIFMNNIAFSF